MSDVDRLAPPPAIGPDERPGFVHNVVAHPLLAMPVLWRIGEFIHEATSPVVPTWRSRVRRFRPSERAGRW